MAKYIRKPEVVEAELYREGMEDRWVVYWTDEWNCLNDGANLLIPKKKQKNILKKNRQIIQMLFLKILVLK